MKNYHLKNGLLAALVLASPMAGAETDYPAADFQPEIVYQDDEYIGKTVTSSEASESGASQAESKYPAADFQPEVVFQDADQIATVAAAAAARSAAAPGGSADPGAEEAAPPLMENYWVGLIGLGLAGFAVLYGRRQKSEVSSKSSASTGDPSGLTGVARYLRTHDMDGSTGVQKYLEKQAQEFTGVERYLRQRG